MVKKWNQFAFSSSASQGVFPNAGFSRNKCTCLPQVTHSHWAILSDTCTACLWQKSELIWDIYRRQIWHGSSSCWAAHGEKAPRFEGREKAMDKLLPALGYVGRQPSAFVFQILPFTGSNQNCQSPRGIYSSSREPWVGRVTVEHLWFLGTPSFLKWGICRAAFPLGHAETLCLHLLDLGWLAVLSPHFLRGSGFYKWWGWLYYSSYRV